MTVSVMLRCSEHVVSSSTLDFSQSLEVDEGEAALVPNQLSQSEGCGERKKQQLGLNKTSALQKRQQVQTGYWYVFVEHDKTQYSLK